MLLLQDANLLLRLDGLYNRARVKELKWTEGVLFSY